MTRRVARAADDGYRNPLVPGLRATADAERLAAALAWADARLEPPGPHPAVAAEPDLEEAIWLAFLLALADPDAHELHEAIVAGHPSWASGELPEIPGVDPRTVPAYRAWAERSGSQAEAFLGEPGWSPERRFGRVFERLALPGLGPRARASSCSSRSAPPSAARWRPTACIPARRRTRRRSRPSACSCRAIACCSSAGPASSRSGCGVRLGALDRALAVWGRGDAPAIEAPAGIRSALGLQ